MANVYGYMRYLWMWVSSSMLGSGFAAQPRPMTAATATNRGPVALRASDDPAEANTRHIWRIDGRCFPRSHGKRTIRERHGPSCTCLVAPVPPASRPAAADRGCRAYLREVPPQGQSGRGGVSLSLWSGWHPHGGRKPYGVRPLRASGGRVQLGDHPAPAPVSSQGGKPVGTAHEGRGVLPGLLVAVGLGCHRPCVALWAGHDVGGTAGCVAVLVLWAAGVGEGCASWAH